MKDIVKTLLSSIVDYAGLFPPAQLEMQAAITTYVQHQTESNSWMLDRFVLPVASLHQVADLSQRLSFKPLILSVILSRDIEKDLQQIDAFHHSFIFIKSLEFPILSLNEIELIDSYLSIDSPTEIELFFEVPLHQDFMPYLQILKEMRNIKNVFAKIRTGGIKPDAFPSVDRLSQFMTACAQINLPFKATAGLHHPLRSQHSVTYAPNSATATMHGFLNVAIGAALLYGQKITPDELPLLLYETSLQSLQFDNDRIFWTVDNCSYELNLTEIAAARQHFFRSFGSCSFAEPVHDLKNLNLL